MNTSIFIMTTNIIKLKILKKFEFITINTFIFITMINIINFKISKNFKFIIFGISTIIAFFIIFIVEKLKIKIEFEILRYILILLKPPIIFII